jgi:5-methylcytosine-specific restriction endonuclease McrA
VDGRDVEVNSIDIRAIRHGIYRSIARRHRSGFVGCFYCRRALTLSTTTLEHKTPLSRGGTCRRGNLALCCADCNHAKGRRTVEEYRAALNGGAAC